MCQQAILSMFEINIVGINFNNVKSESMIFLL